MIGTKEFPVLWETQTLRDTCFESSLPAMEVHGCQLVVVRLRDKGVEGLGLVNEGSCVVLKRQKRRA